MKTEIVKIKGDWQEVVDDCRFTVGKGTLGHEPTEKFKKSILLAEHSPIRDLIIKWRWMGIPHWVSVHWVRHKFEKFVRTQRSDRTGIPRDKLPQDEPQDFEAEANTQSLIDAWRKRLCTAASAETRKLAEDFKITLHDSEPEMANVLVPHCVYRCGCPELNKCGFFDKFIADHPEALTADIQKRYDIYNEWFYSTHKEENYN